MREMTPAEMEQRDYEEYLADVQRYEYAQRQRKEQERRIRESVCKGCKDRKTCVTICEEKRLEIKEGKL